MDHNLIKQVTINGTKFKIQLFPARQALRLNDKTISLLTPLLKTLQGLDFSGKTHFLQSDLKIAPIVSSIQDFFTNLPWEEKETYIMEMVSFCLVDIKDKATISLGDPDDFDTFMRGKTDIVYKLLWEIMKVNQFSFFGLRVGTDQVINIFKNLMENMKKNLANSEKSVILPEK